MYISKDCKVVFFDLDNTLWDTRVNASESLEVMHKQFNLSSLGVINQELFVERFHYHNERLWALISKGQINRISLRTSRFKHLLADFNIKNSKLASALSTEFTYSTPRRKNVLPNALEVLKEVKSQGKKIGIITNGFEDIQSVKLKFSGIGKFTDALITSDAVKAAKPSEKIFKTAFDMLNTNAENSVMIGDDFEADIIGAEGVNLKAIYFHNPYKDEKVVYHSTIYSLTQLLE